MIGLIALAVAALLGGAVTLTFWDEVRDAALDWLRANSLDRGALIEAVVVLDRVAVGIRRAVRLGVDRRQPRQVVVSEVVLALDQITDPAVRAEVAKRQHVEHDVLELF